MNEAKIFYRDFLPPLKPLSPLDPCLSTLATNPLAPPSPHGSQLDWQDEGLDTKTKGRPPLLSVVLLAPEDNHDLG
jgi:hypothetical protein